MFAKNRLYSYVLEIPPSLFFFFFPHAVVGDAHCIHLPHNCLLCLVELTIPYRVFRLPGKHGMEVSGLPWARSQSCTATLALFLLLLLFCFFIFYFVFPPQIFFSPSKRKASLLFLISFISLHLGVMIFHNNTYFKEECRY